MLKVGDKIVLAYLTDMEPGVVRKIEGESAMVDLGGSDLYKAKLDELIKVEDTAEIEFSSPQPEKHVSLFSSLSEKMEEEEAVAELIEKVTASAKFEDEYKDGINNLGVEDMRVTASEFTIGDNVRRIGTKRVGTVIVVSKEDSSYKVKWDNNTITTTWKNELSLV